MVLGNTNLAGAQHLFQILIDPRTLYLDLQRGVMCVGDEGCRLAERFHVLEKRIGVRMQ